MPSAKTQPARGMRDFLPEDVRKREYVIGVIKDVYERYGFEPLETPAVENIETLMGKYGDEGNQLIFKILKRGVHEGSGEADLALRYDLTVPLARVVAEYRDKLPKFFKRYQIQPVWRADRPARGRFREFYQCDVDVLGSRSMIVEAEICGAASEVLTKLGFNDFCVRLNHRMVLTGILGVAGVALEKHEPALVALDKLDKIGSDGVKNEFATRGIDKTAGDRLLSFFSVLSSLEKAADIAAEDKPVQALNKAVLGRIVEFVKDNELGAKGVDELQSILDYAETMGISSRVKIDPTLARGLSYYTGAIMEINVKDLAGSLGGGGRYDNLVGMFLGQDIPACGFSLGLERILVVMSERNMFPAQVASAPADVMVSIWDDEHISESMALAQELRSANLRVDLYPESEKLGKQFKFASLRSVPFVAVIGDEERAKGEVAVKDMRTGEQHEVKRGEVAEFIKQALPISQD
ncbi:MAG TPA: histidine--tRNA ligase [Pyrinomonadaceae bacterium]|nr:histidine--tRNA ligase [Pyrinomonadaceae bacterium]